MDLKILFAILYALLINTVFFSLMNIFCKDSTTKKIYYKLLITEIILFLLYITIPKICIVINNFFSKWEKTEIIDFCSAVIYGLTLLVTAAIAVFGDKLKALFSHPNLQLDFELSFPSVNLTKLGGVKYIPLSETDNGFGIDKELEKVLAWRQEVSFEAYYYRLKVANKGNIDALNIQIMLSKCEIFDEKQSSYKSLDNFLPMNLCWSYHDNDKRTTVEERIAPKMEKYCDFIHVINDNQNKIIFDTLLWVDANHKASNIFDKGKYRIELMFGASNYPTKTKYIEFEYTGNWSDGIKQIQIHHS